MKIGILVLSIGSFGAKGFYNLQEIGLAKALDSLCDEVKVYKLVANTAERQTQDIEGTRNASLDLIPSKQIGSNGIPDMRCIDKNLDALVCFSDTQIMFPKVYRWAEKNKIKLIPYIGVVESHSTNKVKQYVMNCLFSRNVAVYKKCRCCVKTHAVQEILTAFGVNNSIVAPVGIDFSLLNSNFEELNKECAKVRIGFQSTDRVVLLVGRIDADRNPLDSVNVFGKLKKYDRNFKLLIIGKGTLKSELFALLRQAGLEEDVKYIEQLPNSEMWKIYRASEILITFSRTEIFGMSILEAMYYGTVVHAVNAPGPNEILVDHESGYLYNNAIDMENGITENLSNEESIKDNAHKRVVNHFSWYKTAKIIEKY